MYGLPRNAPAEQKLAILLRHLGFDPESLSEDLKHDVVQALRIDHVTRTRPGAVAERAPLLERDLRDAAFVIGYALNPERVLRFISAAAVRDHLAATRPWLMPTLVRHGLNWPDRMPANAA